MRIYFHRSVKYISPEDFTGDIYRTVASILYEQYEKQQVNPAQIMNHFTDEEEHREVASLFHTKIKELTTLGGAGESIERNNHPCEEPQH